MDVLKPVCCVHVNVCVSCIDNCGPPTQPALVAHLLTLQTLHLLMSHQLLVLTALANSAISADVISWCCELFVDVECLSACNTTLTQSLTHTHTHVADWCI